MSFIAQITLPNGSTYDIKDANAINPNLLTNPDFKINQRGQSYYEGTNYSVDRWRGYHGGEKVNVTQDGITIEVVNNQQLCTFIDTPVSAGTALCASIRWRLVEGAYSSVSIIGIKANGYELIASANNESAEEVTTICTGVAQSNYSSLLFSFGGDGTVKPYWTKLEIGSVATPFCPPDPAIELAKCQRYFVRLKNEHASQYAYNGTGYIMNATTAVITLSLPAVMRTPKPTVTASGENIPCIITPSVPAKTPMTATYSNSSAMLANSISLVFTISNGTAGEPAMFLLEPGSDYIDISAEL